MNALLLAMAIAAGSPSSDSLPKPAAITTPAGKKLVCGSPRPLATDSTQTVRVCEAPKKGGK